MPVGPPIAVQAEVPESFAPHHRHEAFLRTPVINPLTCVLHLLLPYIAIACSYRASMNETRLVRYNTKGRRLPPVLIPSVRKLS